MSDFGAILIFKKNTGTFSSTDKTRILTELRLIIKNGGYSSVIKDGDFKTLYEWEGTALCSKLSEYYDDEGADDVREFAEEEDMEEAKSIIAKLKQKLGSEFIITASFEDW